MIKIENALLSLLILLTGTVIGSCGDATNASDRQSDGWKDLFNGKDLSGWTQVSGDAPYKVEDGAIVGTSVTESPNSFLATNEKYDDFILELEFMVDSTLNSGIQFRSLTDPDYRDGRVHGYQYEVDPSDRKWTGGVYDEERRGWLYPLSFNPEASAAFMQGEWNKARIAAIGDTIRTWINDVPAAYVVDSVTAKGIIALQVHSISDKEDAGKQIKWRNIRIKTDDLSLPNDHKALVMNYIPNTLAAAEKEQGWRLLWDGETAEGWRGAHKEEFPKVGWEMNDGTLNVKESGGGESEHGGDIVTREEFDAFELQLQFKLTEGANSGIKYFVTENEEVGQASAIGLEYQLLDDERHPDAKKGRDGNRTLASLYDLKTADKSYYVARKPIGEWNHALLIVRPDNHVEHWLNGIKVLEYERGSEDFRDLVAISKYKDWENFGEAEKGHILLQDHGNRVSFRSIKIKDLTE